MDELHAENRRRNIRFSPSADELQDLHTRSVQAMAHIDLNAESETFQPTLMGMLGDQSHSGCSVAFLRKNEPTNDLKQGMECLVKAGRLHPLRAVVRWRRDMDDDFFKIGFQFLE